MLEAKKPDAIEKPANCMNCNKRLKRKYWYYRNSGYYCGKGCWEQARLKAKKKDQAQKA